MAIIHLLGLGGGDYRELTLGTVELLRSGLPVYLRTRRHPSVSWLDQHDIPYESFDELYEQADDFTTLYQQIVERLTVVAMSHGEIIYAIPGHPLVAERVSELLLQRGDVLEVRVHPAVSAVESIAASLKLDPAAGLILQDALEYKPVAGNLPQLIFQVYNRRVAGDLKLILMENYDDGAEITLIQAAGLLGQERIMRLPLYELDHQDWLDHLTSLYISASSKRTASRYPLDPLVEIMERLRGDNGCPWDQEQDHLSLRRYCLEEACEVIAALDSGDTTQIVDELGDLLLQIAFHACIGAEEGEFDFGDVVQAICAKMVRRHPHVFGEVQVANSGEVLQNWEAIKQQERGGSSTSLLKGVGDGLPALTRARKLQEKAASIGFDWPDRSGPEQKVREELHEVLAAEKTEDQRELEMELGDLFFSLVNWARFLEIDPELALMRSCEKFRQRFLQIEKESERQAKNLNSMTLSEMDAIWERAKRQSKD